MNKKKVLGFTLVELMITIAVVGVLASMAVPSYSKMIERNKLKEVAQGLKSDLMFARAEAIKRSQDVTVSRNTGDNGAWCYGLTTNASCDCTATPSTCEIKTISGTGFAQTNIKTVFDADTTFDFRRGTSANANTCFSTTNYTVKVTTNLVGRIMICTNNNSTALLGIDFCPAGDAVCAL